MQKVIVNGLIFINAILMLIVLYFGYIWYQNPENQSLEPKIIIILTLISIIGLILGYFQRKKLQCPYDSKKLHDNQRYIVKTSIEKLQNELKDAKKLIFREKLLLENNGVENIFFPIILLTKNEVRISDGISLIVDNNSINTKFINILKTQCARNIWDNLTYRLIGLTNDNQLIIGESSYCKTLSTCDLHYYNFMKDNDMNQCRGRNYQEWFKALKKIVFNNDFTEVSGSIGCSTLLVIKNYDNDKYQYYISNNSAAKNPVNTKHVIPSFMFAPTANVVNPDDFKVQADITLQMIKEFGEELLGIEALEHVNTMNQLKNIINKTPLLVKLQELLVSGAAELKILGVSLDIFRLRPEILTTLIIDDENFFNDFIPKLSWETEDVAGLGLYNIDDTEKYLELIFDNEIPLVSPAMACLKLGREYIIHTRI